MNGFNSSVYHLFGLDEEYRVVYHECIPRKNLTIEQLMFQTVNLMKWVPTGIEVYGIEDYYDVYSSGRESMRKNSVEARVEFKILLDTKGIKII
jgi:hypothetical protein